MRQLKKCLLLMMCACVLCGMTACSSDKDVDNSATDTTKDNKDDGVMDDAVNDVTDGIDDVTDDVTDGIDDATDDMTDSNDSEKDNLNDRNTNDKDVKETNPDNNAADAQK